MESTVLVLKLPTLFGKFVEPLIWIKLELNNLDYNLSCTSWEPLENKSITHC